MNKYNETIVRTRTGAYALECACTDTLIQSAYIRLMFLFKLYRNVKAHPNIVRSTSHVYHTLKNREHCLRVGRMRPTFSVCTRARGGGYINLQSRH